MTLCYRDENGNPLGISMRFNSVNLPPQFPVPPEGVCGYCSYREFNGELANTFCYDMEWIVLGHDDYAGTKHLCDEGSIYRQRSDGNWEKLVSSTPPRFLWARGMWGMQVRYYKDINT